MPASPKLSTAIDEYVRHLQSKRQPYGTWASRRSALRALLDASGDIDTAKVSAYEVDLLFATHQEWGLSHCNNVLSTLKQFFAWCRFRKYMPIDSNPVYGWSFWKYQTADRMRIPVGEWPRLFEACHTPTETITVATGLYLFLRASEQQGIQLKHVRLTGASPTIEIHRLKTREWGLLPVSAELQGYVYDHLKWHAQHGTPKPDHYLICAHTKPRNFGEGFVPGSGTPNPERPLYKPWHVVQRVLERAGYPSYREGEHTLRRSGARAYFDSLVEQGYDGALRRVQWFLGHKSSAMTERYLGLSLEKHLVQQEVGGKPMFPALQDAKIIPIRKDLS